MKKNISFNHGWRFAKTADIPSSFPYDWEPVDLPHTWNASDGQDGGNDYYRGTCIYAKEFPHPPTEENGQSILEFNGAAMSADVYVNGRYLCHHDGGYSTFRVNITDSLRDVNLVVVVVDNTANDRVYPQKADFTFYGGIYRDVNLITVPENHFDLMKYGASGIKVTPKVIGKHAEVTVEVWLCGCCDKVSVVIDGTSLDASVSNGKATASITLENAHLWNGVHDPYLYTAMAKMVVEGKTVDEVSTRFGCRAFGFDAEKGFLLNGRPYPLRGVSRHQDRRCVGNALTPEMHREDMEIIREIGANTVRLAHYQHAQYFYDLCDEEGMVVWAEIPYITQHMPNGRENTLSQMSELVTQCYNHPSIACWGLSNEITASGNVTEDMMENHRLLNDLCHKLDHTRPTAMAHVFMLETDSPIIDIPDIGSYNLYFGWYLGDLQQNNDFFDEFHSEYPNRVIGFSEYGADANSRFQTSTPDRGDYTETYQAVYHEHLLSCIEARPYLWATHVWNMFDFAADGRDEGGEHGVNQKGLVTMDRKIRKDAFYLYKAAWSDAPFIHICGRRYVDRMESVTEIKIYTNQTHIELFVDGTPFGEMNGSRIFRFHVPITGEHTIRAKAGECTDTIKIRKVSEPNKDYLFVQDGGIINWFEKEDFRPGYFSIKDTRGEILANEKAAPILQKLLAQMSASRGEVAQSTAGNANLQKMMAGMTVESMLKRAGKTVSAEQVKELNDALQQIKKPE